jgi:hypothetical protein
LKKKDKEEILKRRERQSTRFHRGVWELRLKIYELCEELGYKPTEVAGQFGISGWSARNYYQEAWKVLHPNTDYGTKSSRRKISAAEEIPLPCHNCTNPQCESTGKQCRKLKTWLHRFTLPPDNTPFRFNDGYDEEYGGYKDSKPNIERAKIENAVYRAYPLSKFEWNTELCSDPEYNPYEKPGIRRGHFLWHSPDAVRVFFWALHGSCFDSSLVDKGIYRDTGRWGLVHWLSTPSRLQKLRDKYDAGHPVDKYGRCRHKKSGMKCSICAPSSSPIFSGERERTTDAVSNLQRIYNHPLFRRFHTPKKGILELSKSAERKIKKRGRRLCAELEEQIRVVWNTWGCSPTKLREVQIQLQREYSTDRNGKIRDKFSDPKKLAPKRARGFAIGMSGPRNPRIRYTAKLLNKLFDNVKSTGT